MENSNLISREFSIRGDRERDNLLDNESVEDEMAAATAIEEDDETAATRAAGAESALLRAG